MEKEKPSQSIKDSPGYNPAIAFPLFWPRITIIEDDDMCNLGLVAPEPNAFVNTGTPRIHQMWVLKTDPTVFARIMPLIGNKGARLQDIIAYELINTEEQQNMLVTVPMHQFLELYYFSH